MEPYPTPNLVKQDLNKILNEIKFVNKIVFGKLNYSVKSSQFKGNAEFYEDCANTIKNFCKKEDIQYHIKYGTQKRDNKATEKIFRSH